MKKYFRNLLKQTKDFMEGKTKEDEINNTNKLIRDQCGKILDNFHPSSQIVEHHDSDGILYYRIYHKGISLGKVVHKRIINNEIVSFELINDEK